MDTQFFYNKIIKKMPSNLSDLEKARYIYIELGKLFTFDENYLYAPSKVQKRIYKMAVDDKVNFHELAERKRSRALCVSISQVYSSLLNSVGIPAQVYKEDYSDPHVNTIISINNQKYIADLQRDLIYIHSHRNTRFFGASLLYKGDDISKDLLKHVDYKIGYDTDNEIFISKKIVELVIGLKDEKSLTSKVNSILSSALEIPNVSKMDYFERSTFCNWLLGKVLTTGELSNIQKRDLSVLDFDVSDPNRENYLLCFAVKQNKKQSKKDENSVFVFSPKYEKFIKFSSNKFNEILKNSKHDLSAISTNVDFALNKNLNNNIIGGRNESR